MLVQSYYSDCGFIVYIYIKKELYKKVVPKTIALYIYIYKAAVIKLIIGLNWGTAT